MKFLLQLIFAFAFGAAIAHSAKHITQPRITFECITDTECGQ